MLLLVADDLTGGNDAGIQFVKHGMSARLALSPDCAASTSAEEEHAQRPDVLVVNTGTRNLPGHEAAQRIAHIMRSLCSSMPETVFKKIDSTLRGNPGCETDAIMNACGFDAAFLAPSYPGQGRTVKDGVLLVNGVPVHETVFAQDPLTPIAESAVAAIMGVQSARKSINVPLAELELGTENVVSYVLEHIRQGVSLFIFDAATAAHLAVVAAAGLALRKRPLFIGSAGLAEALAEALPQTTTRANVDAQRDAIRNTTANSVFFICGSANQATHKQIAELSAVGTPIVRMAETFRDMPDAEEETAKRAAKELEKGAVVLATPLGRISASGDVTEGMALSKALAAIALGVLQKNVAEPHAAALVMTGGETAYAVLQLLGSALALHEEIAPGIALCTLSGGPWHGLRVVTKAGGFGAPSALVNLLNMLQRGNAA